jgi:hypothetical protein
VTTSDRPLGARIEDYLTSRKHMAGTVGGLAGVGLALTGVSGPLWPLVVAGLYGVGALAAPPGRSSRARRREAAAEASRLRNDLDRLAYRVRVAGRELPAEASDAFARIADRLGAMLGHATTLAEPEVLHVLSTTIGKDLHAAIAGYLDLPELQRHRPLPTGRLAGEELTHQLALMEEYVTKMEAYVTSTADEVFSDQLDGIVSLTMWLEARQSLESHELDLSRDDP